MVEDKMPEIYDDIGFLISDILPYDYHESLIIQNHEE
jgi:hypothetical protein